MGNKILWHPHPHIRAPDDDGNDGDSSVRINPARGCGNNGGMLEFCRAARRLDLPERRRHRHHHSLIELMDGSLVVVQEVALTAMLLAVHGEIIHQEEAKEGGGGGGGIDDGNPPSSDEEGPRWSRRRSFIPHC